MRSGWKMGYFLSELGKVISDIGSIPGCNVLEYSVNEIYNNTLEVEMKVKVRALTWHEKEENWSFVVNTDRPETFTQQLNNAVGNKIRIQRGLFEKSLEEYENLMIIPKSDVRHLHVDALVLWAMASKYYSPELFMDRINSEVGVHITRHLEKGVLCVKSNGVDDEVAIPLQKSLNINDLGEIIIRGNCLTLPVSFPESIITSIPGRTFSEVINLEDKWGVNLHNIVKNRVIEHVEVSNGLPGRLTSSGKMTLFRLSPQHVKIKDIGTMDLSPYIPERAFW